MEGGNVAVYLDFENLAISAETVYPKVKKPLGIEPIMDFVIAKGAIRIKRAYADWSKELFAQYQPGLMEKGFELIHLPATNLQGKNGSDVRLAIDVMEMLEQFHDIDTIIIGSGDTDFIPLIQRLRSRGKMVVVMGFEHSVGNLVKLNSAEYKSLEELLQPYIEAEKLAGKEEAEPDLETGKALMYRFLQQRSENGPILMARLKQHLLRLDPGFSEKSLGFSSFKQFIEALLGDPVEKIEMEQETLPLVFLREQTIAGTKTEATEKIKETAIRFLHKKLRYQQELSDRLQVATALIQAFEGRDLISMTEMFDLIYENLNRTVPKTDIKKYVNTLFTGGAFDSDPEQPNGPLLARPFRLKKELNNAEEIDQVYIQRVSEILQSRYTELSSFDLLELLF
jgi:uncharacterized protein (TIGR00288 family)